MAHWAELDENNIVIRVLVGDNNEPDEGYQWLVDNLGGRWIKTSYNNNFRARFAGIGFLYNEDLDAFIKPKPFQSWILDEETTEWKAPIPKPREDRFYSWNESTASWQLPPSPFPSWTLIDDLWTPPIPRPEDDGKYIWDEENQNWKKFEVQ